MDSIKGGTGMSLQEPSRAVEDSALWTSLMHGVAQVESVACDTLLSSMPHQIPAFGKHALNSHDQRSL